MIECSICKASNEDRSLYCLECGQRLQPKVQDPVNNAAAANVSPVVKQNPYQSSGKLHSPILDLGGQTGRNTKAANMQFGPAEHNQVSNGRMSNSGRISHNGLHSPLLDGNNYFVNPYPDPDSDSDSNTPNEPPNRNADKSRLHSPVLDGPFSGSNNSGYVQDDFPTEEQEYESLRSPLLKAKVPLPEAHDQLESGQTIQSVLSSATGPLPKVEPDSTNAFGIGQTGDPPLSFTGISKLKNATAQKLASQPTIEKRQIGKTSQSLLPVDVDNENSTFQNNSSVSNKSSLNKILIVPLIFLALGFKVYYFTSLGSAAYTSTPFILDQAGQALIMILVLILAVNVKN